MILDSLTFPLTREVIETCLPHREPFLLVDEISAAKKHDFITGHLKISPTSDVFRGHFPKNPIWPGVLIVEGLAQVGGILGHVSSVNGLTECFLLELNEARFRKMVLPGNVLDYRVDYIKHRGTFYWFEGHASVDGNHVATVKFSATMR